MITKSLNSDIMICSFNKIINFVKTPNHYVRILTFSLLQIQITQFILDSNDFACITNRKLLID